MLLRAGREGGGDDASGLRWLTSGGWEGGFARGATPSPVVELEVVEAAVIAGDGLAP